MQRNSEDLSTMDKRHHKINEQSRTGQDKNNHSKSKENKYIFDNIKYKSKQVMKSNVMLYIE